MLKHFVILLDDTSVSFCHHNNTKTGRYAMPLDVLKDGIKFGMKENLYFQFVLPDYQLPVDYWREMMSVDHVIIVPGSVNYMSLIPKDVYAQLPDVVVYENISDCLNYRISAKLSSVLKVDKCTFFDNIQILLDNITKYNRLNIFLTDIESFSYADFDKYKDCLEIMANGIKQTYLKGVYPQINILTDRMMLKAMNNCNAGVSNVTLAPNGKFYTCPAFYQADSSTLIRNEYEIGSVRNGVNILNPNLYKIEYAPLCRLCDAYHCKRCVWLNNKLTYEMNTPSHEQCVLAHIERNVSRRLLDELKVEMPHFFSDFKINEIDYLDPFDII